MDEDKTANNLLKEYGEKSIDVVDLVIRNHPHEIIERCYVDSGGNDTDEKYFKLVPNELFWQGVKNKLTELLTENK